ncbi:MAG: DUF1552 domain-containing protein [Myxococcales bacterium]|nr:DUF1552 domain-containing protein [Myxococcales bacterium]
MSRHLSRRTFLRGSLVGGATVAVGVPLLEAMMNLGGTALADGGALPRRFVLWFWGNGTHPGAWAPTTTGAGWEPTPLLRGLAPVREYVNVVSGTSLPVRRRNNPHVEGAVGILAGGNPVIDPAYASESNDWDFMTVSGPTVDEVAADVLGPARFRSLVLAVTPLHGVRGPGTAVRYTSHRGPYLYNEPTFDPGAVFDMLFGVERPPDGPTPEDLARASVLDAVLDEARSLEGRLGASDRTRLEHHLDAVRDLERRVRGEGGSSPSACETPERPASAASYRARARIMAELSAMAFACDLTRVVSMEFSSPASHSGYPDIFPTGLVHNGSPISFHEYEHNVGYSANTRTGLQYFVDVFGDFLVALRDVEEGDGNVLDRSLVLGTSELSGGAEHSFGDFPLLVAGRAGGALRYPGAHVRLERAMAQQIPFTCLRALGWTGESWGTAQFATRDEVDLGG